MVARSSLSGAARRLSTRAWLAGVLVVGVMASALWSMFALSARSAHHHRVALQTSQLQTAVGRLEAAEWHAMADAGIGPVLESDISAASRGVDDLVRQLDSTARSTHDRISPYVRTYVATLDEELALLRAGDVAAARVVDRERLDPQLASLVSRLDDEMSDARRAATDAERLLRTGSVVVLLVAGSAIVAILGQSRRVHNRVLALRAEAEAMEASDRRSLALLDDAADGIMLVGGDGEVLFATPLAGQLMSVPVDELIGAHLTTAEGGGTVAALVERARSGPTGSDRAEWRVAVDGAGRYVEAIANARYTGGPDGAVLVTLRDVTEHRHLEALLTHRATHDPLTGLANRDELVKGLNLATATRVTAPSALVFLDLDGFKEINDGFGHDVGDDVLRAVARRLEGSVRPRDIAARLGGDEFGVLLRDVEDADAARVRVERLRAVFHRPVSVQRESLAVHASLGVVMIDEHQADTDVRDLLRDADVAMYASKLGRRHSVVFYTPALATHRADSALGDAAQPGGG